MSSIAYQSFGPKQAAWFSKRIVIGTILDKGTFRFPGSEAHPPQPEGAALSYVRIRVERTLKGPDVDAGAEVRVFSSMEWFRHTHAALIQGGVISYADPHYSGGLAPDQIEPGGDVLCFLADGAAPPEFPPGSVFLAFGEACDRAEREKDVLAALQEGRPEKFDQPIRLEKRGRVRLPDGLVIAYLSHSHKRSRVEGPWKEWIDLELSKDGDPETLALAHATSTDRKESWETRRWRAYSVELQALAADEAFIVVRKPSNP